ncbi:MAG: DUF6516 family protein [candidate division KSB1 bacterium]|nr:DUF6516 family protein [candidate division KSB1 bacterium]MDZ7303172.1 DUF6516 family protein [candidate division KSB1 bacterium]MDZ7310151.1 DUF6516 family protein [candidate division KSB1 bacterium]
MKHGTLAKFRDLIVSVEFLRHESTKNLELYKCKVILRDGTNLRVLEKYRNDNLVYYSYYWLAATNELIVGWDNAPHHPRLKIFPHHKHLAVRKKPVISEERNLSGEFKFIAKRLL